MIEFLTGLPEWARVTLAMAGMLTILALAGGLMYRLIKFGIFIKYRDIEIDADNDPGDRK